MKRYSHYSRNHSSRENFSGQSSPQDSELFSAQQEEEQEEKVVDSLQRIYISSQGIETVLIEHENPETREKLTKSYVQGSINGDLFRVVCDEQVDVKTEIAHILMPLIHKQQLEKIQTRKLHV